MDIQTDTKNFVASARVGASHISSTLLCVYIPPRAIADTSCNVNHSKVVRLQTQHAEAFIVISVYFNHVALV